MSIENTDQTERPKPAQEFLREFFAQSEQSFEAHMKVGLQLLDEVRPIMGKIGPPSEGPSKRPNPMCHVVTISNVNEKGELEVICGTNEYLAVVAAIALMGKSSIGAHVGASLQITADGLKVTSEPLLVNGSAEVQGSIISPASFNEKPTLIY